MKASKIFFFFLILGAIFVAGCSADKNTSNTIKENSAEVTIYKSESCGCCGIYSDYLRSKGDFDLEVVNVENIYAVKEKYMVPKQMESCHTTVIGNYFVEGHIPLEAINKLLTEKPDILGIAMPGMPSGSPGMPGSKTEDFVIYAVKKDGSYEAFMNL